MSALVIKDLPDELHRRLKEDAERNHRSMTQQTIVILERALHRAPPIPDFTPVKGAFRLTNDFINKAKRKGRT
jgi:plasmid stability protein